MQSNILIIGAGFAGVWSALSAARLLDQAQRADISISVLAPSLNCASARASMRPTYTA